MKRTLAIATVAIALATIVAACDHRQLYAESHRVEEHGWPSSEWLEFGTDIDDTLAVCNFLVDLRVSQTYPYSNSFLFITTTFPDGSVAADTMECPLAAPDGQWLGRRTGRYVDNRYYFRKNMRFPMAGHYRFSVGHGMRDTAIKGIKDVGLRIELAK
ncbi:MAG: gliding motility lipoprotein GldH [Bacteroidales bacterium]|nr:gliding motility lipoprotein GldH [Bacteroidales bacterium]